MIYTTTAELYTIYQKHSQVFIDTRKELQSAIFFAIGRKNEDGVHRGNEFAERALESGQAAYVVINDKALKAKYALDHRFLLVEDSEEMLRSLAKMHRQHLNIPILAIAGSNGKTTIKELIHAVLSTKYNTFSTVGNLNNHLGVPLSLLSINEVHEMAVLEIGANHLHETRFLAEIIDPDYGLVTNCGKDHLGEYGSIENIIKANKELYDVLAEKGKTAFVSQNNQLLMKISSHVSNREYFGESPKVNGAILEAPFIRMKLNIGIDHVAVQTQLFGRFWLDTLLGAAAIGAYFDVPILDIKNAIERYQPAALRSQLIEWNGNKVLLDCYNANPSSMEVFVEEIQGANSSEGKILVLGEMLELGSYSQEEHQKLINKLDLAQFDEIILMGKEFKNVDLPKGDKLSYFELRADLESYVANKKFSNKYIFVKGSRGNKLESLFGVG